MDRAAITYGQNRAVQIGGRTFYYVIRDLPKQPDKIALFRVENARARQISPAWNSGDVDWSYVSPSGKQLLLARAQGDDWQWTLYQIEAGAVKKTQDRDRSGRRDHGLLVARRKNRFGRGGCQIVDDFDSSTSSQTAGETRQLERR